MQLHYCSAKTEEELKQILQLQKINLPKAITEEERVKEGFVTVSHTLDLLKRMNSTFPHTIVKDGEKVVGYALSMHPVFGSEIEILKPMFEQIKRTVPTGMKYIVMGQICVAKAYRGKGVFRKLYQSMWNAVRNEFDSIITEVDASNIRSLKAHLAVGFKEMKVYRSSGREWYLIILQEGRISE